MKDSVITDETEESKRSAHSFLFKSIHNTKPGLFSQFWSRKSTEKSYLRIYVQHTNKVWAIIDQKLIILCSNGILYSVDVNEEGMYYADTNPKIKKTELYSEKLYA